jgi:dTDP-4-dehydrorhamnose reductase
LDVCNKEHVLSACNFAPDFIIHCASLVDADFCQAKPELARASIFEGTKNMAQLATKTNAKFFYPQTFLVYDGQENPITEETKTNPLSVYGQEKLEAEKLVLQIISNSLVVRMAGFFGGGIDDTNFVGKIVPLIAKYIKQGKKIIEVGDRIWQPTFTDDLAVNCLALLEEDKSGIYCMASHGQASFFDLTVEIVKILNLSDQIEVKQVSATCFANREAAARPFCAVIDNKRLRSENLDMQRDWREALAEYLELSYFRNMF